MLPVSTQHPPSVAMPDLNSNLMGHRAKLRLRSFQQGLLSILSLTLGPLCRLMYLRPGFWKLFGVLDPCGDLRLCFLVSLVTLHLQSAIAGVTICNIAQRSSPFTFLFGPALADCNPVLIQALRQTDFFMGTSYYNESHPCSHMACAEVALLRLSVPFP